MAQTTRLGLYGGPERLQGEYSAKGTKGTGPFTRLALYGGPRPLYGSFAGKGSSARSGIQRQRMADRQRDGLFNVEEDDENVIRAVIAKFMEVV